MPTTHMNPVLLKPQSDVGAQLIVRGRMAGTLDASAYARDKRALLEVAVESYRRLAGEAQLVIVEGAGSPAETNLRKNDIANMGLAQAMGLPVVLVNAAVKNADVRSALQVAERGRIPFLAGEEVLVEPENPGAISQLPLVGLHFHELMGPSLDRSLAQQLPAGQDSLRDALPMVLHDRTPVALAIASAREDPRETLVEAAAVIRGSDTCALIAGQCTSSPAATR